MAASLALERDSGVILSDVSPHGAAEAAGLEPGDVVLSIDGKPIRELRDFMITIFRQPPGSELKLEIQRGRERLTKTVAVVERKNEPGQLEDLASYESALVRELGVLAVTLDEKVNALMPNLRRLAGVVVAAVPAEFAGLNPGLIEGDVIYSMNNIQIANMEQLRAALTTKKSGDPITFHVERAGQLIYVTAALE
jgi:serine protease Do